jgi:hypothetical protein
MNCICPECKNQIDMSKHPKAAIGHVIECETCGILLEIRSINNNIVETEIVDEGK